MEGLKEYLELQPDGTYRLWTAKPTANYIDGWIEVPEGAEFAFRCRLYSGISFHKSNGTFGADWDSKELEWITRTGKLGDWYFENIVWQRPTLPEALPFIDDEPQAYYGNAIRPKPRMRMYAGIGCKVINVTMHVPAPVKEIKITGTIVDCIQVPKASADYLFNTVRQMLADDFLSKDQKESVLHHLNYLRVY